MTYQGDAVRRRRITKTEALIESLGSACACCYERERSFLAEHTETDVIDGVTCRRSVLYCGNCWTCKQRYAGVCCHNPVFAEERLNLLGEFNEPKKVGRPPKPKAFKITREQKGFELHQNGRDYWATDVSDAYLEWENEHLSEYPEDSEEKLDAWMDYYVGATHLIGQIVIRKNPNLPEPTEGVEGVEG